MKFLLILCEILILGITHQVDAQLSDKFYIRHLEPPEGPGYDLFYYDGESLRDEKWRFDYANHDTAVHRRFGLKDQRSSQFHVVDTLSDANGFRQKSRILPDPGSIESLLAMGVAPPTTLTTFQKYGTMPRIKLRDNSNQEGQPRDPTFGLLNGVTLGVTLNRPSAPGDSFVQGFVSTGLGALNNRPPIQFGLPNLGILPGNRPSNNASNRPQFSFPFFGNNQTPSPFQTEVARPPPPPPPPQSGLFGLPFGGPPPMPPALVQPNVPQQQNFFSGFQNLKLPFIGQSQPTTTTTTEPTVPITNPSLFANFPNFGFQNSNKPTTTVVTTPTTPAPQGPFANLFSSFGQTTTSTTVAPETTTIAQGPFGFNLPSISGLFQNNNGKGASKKTDTRFGPPSHAHGHRHQPNHPQNHPSKHQHQHPPPPFNHNGGNGVQLEPAVNELPRTTTENVVSNTYQFFPLPQDVTPPSTSTTTVEKIMTTIPNETGLLESNAVELSTDPDIPPPIQKPYVDSLVAVVEPNSYALGIQETSTYSFSNVEPVNSFSILPEAVSRSDDTELTTSKNIPADPIQKIIHSLTKLEPEVVQQTTTTTTENNDILIDGDQNTAQIIADINSLSDNPPFPILPSAAVELPPSSLPFPILELVPPFETEPDELGLHEDLALSKISSPESNSLASSTVPGIIELIQKSKEKNISNEIVSQTDGPSVELNFINNLEQRNEVKLPETDILPPFEYDDTRGNATTENTITTVLSTSEPNTSTPSSIIIKGATNNVVPPETDLLPPFVLSSTSTTTNIPTTTTETYITTTLQSTQASTTSTAKPLLEPIVVPEIDLLPPFELVSVSDVEKSTLTVPVMGSSKTTPTTPQTTQPTVISRFNLTLQSTQPSITSTSKTLLQPIVVPEIDLLPPFEVVSVNDVENTTFSVPVMDSTETTPTTPQTTQPTIISRFNLDDLNNITAPETDLLPPFEENRVSDVTENKIDIPTISTLELTSTTAAIPRTSESTVVVSIELTNFTVPEIDLLPPLQSIPNLDALVSTTTLQPAELTTTQRTASEGQNNLIPPETELLPPFEGSLVLDVVENITDTPIPNSNIPKTTPTTTTSITTSSTTTTPLVVLTHQTNLIVPEIDLLPPLEGVPASKDVVISTPSTTTNRPKTTTSTSQPQLTPEVKSIKLEKYPEIGLLPPFETTINKQPSTTPLTTTSIPRTTTDKIPITTTTTTTAPRILIRPPESDLLPPFEVVDEKIKENLIDSTIKLPADVPGIKSPEIDLLPPLENSSVPIRTTTLKTITTTAKPVTTTPVSTTQKITKVVVTTAPRTVTNRIVQPIYYRPTTASALKQIKNISTTTRATTIQSLSTETTPINEIRSRFSENSQNDTSSNSIVIGLLSSAQGVSKIMSTIKPPLKNTIPKIMTSPKPSTIPSTTKPTVAIPTITEKPVTITTNTTTIVFIPKPSKLFLSPFETPTYKITNHLDNATTDKIPKQLEHSTIRGETDKIVDSIRKLIEHTSQTVLPTITTDVPKEPNTSTTTPTARFERSSTPTARTRRPTPASNVRQAPKHAAKHNKHKQHPHIRQPEIILIPPPIRNPGQVDVYELNTFITQNGQRLDGLTFYPKLPERDLLPPLNPNVDEMHASSVLPSPVATTTESAAGNQLTTKSPIKRPVFVNVDGEDDMETTTTILDTRLSPNAIKSLIG